MYSSPRAITSEGTLRSRNHQPHLDPLEPRRLLTTWYVDASSPGPAHDGTAWPTAYADLQLALAAATPGDTIKVAQGTYKPTTTTDRTISFNLKPGITVSGGYAGASNPSPDSRDVSLYPTLLSGNIGSAASVTDNSYHVVLADGGTLDGLTLTAGNANATAFAPGGAGGAVLVSNSAAPTFTNCTFTANKAALGGALYALSNSNVLLTACTFSANSATDSGGALYASSSSSTTTFLTANQCTFSANSAPKGGAAYDAGTYLYFTTCTFSANTSTGNGGAIYASYNPGFYDGWIQVTLSACTFTRNSADNGGAIYSTAQGKYTNSLFVDNAAATYGGAVFLSQIGTVNILHCDFVANRAGSGEGGLLYQYSFYGNSLLTSNCIFWANTAPKNPQAAWTSTAVAHFTYCDVQGGLSGPGVGSGILNADPRFYRDPSAGPDNTWGTPDDDYGDLRLLPGSPCIDTGSNSFTSPTDMAGTSRPVDFPAAGPANTAVADMGAYEASSSFGALSIPAGLTVTLPAGGFSATSLTLGAGAKLDLADASLTLPATSAATVRSYLASGQLFSSTPDPASNHRLGYVPTGPADLLIKRTLSADANLDGIVSADDAALYDRGRLFNGSTWWSGDFDYDGQITDADAALLHHALAPAGGEPTLVVTSDPPTAVAQTANPEPAPVANPKPKRNIKPHKPHRPALSKPRLHKALHLFLFRH